ncbi:MAG: glycoside hydrolase family 10 protein [Candidatus Fimenecus sp.]
MIKKSILIILVFAFVFSSCEKSTNDNTAPPEIPSRYIIGAWINYNEIHELVDSASNQSEFDETVESKLKILNTYDVNTVFLHCRAFDDCFYQSDIFPVSEYASNETGELKFDVLETFIRISKKYNIQIHAWINPYRIRKDGIKEKVNPLSPAYEIINSGNLSQELILCDNAIYYNPASGSAQKRILQGIREILENYKVAGIHFDDYFYPSTSNDIDNLFYNEYTEKGGKLSLQDYRRQCVNTMISSVYSLIKSYDDDLIFSISPAANIDSNYNSSYAEVALWTQSQGYADWIIPQIYFGFDHEKMPFLKVLEQWKNLTAESQVKLIIGLPLYKSGKEDVYAGAGAQEWQINSDIILRQIKYINDEERIGGYVFYSASYLYNDISKDENSNILSE